MTTPSERTRAVLLTESFLLTLTNPKLSPKIPSGIREQAKALLRHYPSKSDLEITQQYFDSILFQCPFGNPEGL